MATAKVTLKGNVILDLTDATATADKILDGYTAYGADGTKLIGTATGGGSTPTLQSKSATPTESTQTITPDSGYDGLSSVEVGAISSSYVGTGISRKSSTDLTEEDDLETGLVVTAPAGYYANGATKLIPYANPDTSTIRYSRGLLLASINVDSAGYIPEEENVLLQGGIPVADVLNFPTNNDSDIIVSGNTVTIPYGWYDSDVSKSVSSGRATAPASISGTSATVTTGTNTLTLSKSISVTPSVTAGYISSGTAGNSTVSLTANITTQAAKTVTPTKSSQTAVASGVYTTGAVTVAAIPSNYITTTDANAAATDIVSGKTAYVNGSKITGSLVTQAYYTGSSTPSSSLGSNGDLYLKVVS